VLRLLERVFLRKQGKITAGLKKYRLWQGLLSRSHMVSLKQRVFELFLIKYITYTTVYKLYVQNFYTF